MSASSDVVLDSLSTTGSLLFLKELSNFLSHPIVYCILHILSTYTMRQAIEFEGQQIYTIPDASFEGHAILLSIYRITSFPAGAN